MVSTWIKEDPAVAHGGDVGGDYQATRAFSVRWRAERDHTRVVTAWFYGINPNANETTSEPYYEVECQLEYTVLADSADMDSARWTECSYREITGIHTDTATAEKSAHYWAENMTGEDIEWNGKLPWEH